MKAPTLLIPPQPGQIWTGQGGVYAGVMRGAPGKPAYHLIVGNDARATVSGVAWGGRGETSDATCEWDGLANTHALVKSGVDHPAAQALAKLEIDGHQDWYLMSRREAALCYANVPELFDTREWYWTSTQYSASYAWSCYFYYGGQYNGLKSFKGSAVAVRRLVLQSFGPSTAEETAP